jgi:hypothetical protein
MKELYNPDNLDDAQIEWIWLCSKFDNILEIDFFKPYWVPLEVNSYDYFMDISDENYPVFDINYFFYEPYKWYKKYISTDIKEVLLSPETGLGLRKILEENDKTRWSQVGEFFKERRRLRYEGKIHIEPVNHFEIIPELSNLTKVKIGFAASSVSVSDVTSIIAGLLPFNLRIDLKQICYEYGAPNLKTDKIRFIRDFVFFLRDTGLRRVNRYRIDFHASENCYLEYKTDKCILHHSEQHILVGFADSINILINK